MYGVTSAQPAREKKHDKKKSDIIHCGGATWVTAKIGSSLEKEITRSIQLKESDWFVFSWKKKFHIFSPSLLRLVKIWVISYSLQ